jgi:uncharacterized membrane protein YdbT with pleckstrin-like domain
VSEAHPPQQPDRLAKRAIIATAVVAVAIILACLLVSAWVTPHEAGGFPERDEARTLRYRYEDPGHPPSELREAVAAQLERYGWVDREAGVVHVPLELGMELYLETAGQEVP